MRVRLAVLDTEQHHISCKRLDETPTMWPVGFPIREVEVALPDFTDALVRLSKPGATGFEHARVTLGGLLPPRLFDRMTAVDLAPRQS